MSVCVSVCVCVCVWVGGCGCGCGCVCASVFEHSVKMAGAQRMSFPPVVAGGPRATCLHYITNNRDLE